MLSVDTPTPRTMSPWSRIGRAGFVRDGLPRLEKIAYDVYGNDQRCVRGRYSTSLGPECQELGHQLMKRGGTNATTGIRTVGHVGWSMDMQFQTSTQANTANVRGSNGLCV